MFSGHIASFMNGVSKVQDFGNFELSPMDVKKKIHYLLFPKGLCFYKYSLSVFTVHALFTLMKF